MLNVKISMIGETVHEILEKKVEEKQAVLVQEEKNNKGFLAKFKKGLSKTEMDFSMFWSNKGD